MRSSGRTGTRFSSRPVASRSAATTAAVETTAESSPTPLAPKGTPGSGSSMSVEENVGTSRMVGERRIEDPAPLDLDLLHHGQPDALRRAALDLPVDALRVDRLADVLGG